MAQMTKSVRMRGMNLLHFVLMVAVMTIVWLTMYSPFIEPQTAQITTTAVLLCYLVLSVFLYQTYNAYKIGMYRAGETFYSLTLANLIGNALTYGTNPFSDFMLMRTYRQRKMRTIHLRSPITPTKRQLFFLP